MRRKKTEYLSFNKRAQNVEVYLQEEKLKRVEKFKYLGSTAAEDGEFAAEVNHRVPSE